MDAITILYEGELMTSFPFSGEAKVVTDPKAFSPIDLFVSSLGSCVLTLMGMAAKRLCLDLSGSKVLVKKAMSRSLPRRVAEIEIHFSCPRAFSPSLQEELEKAGRECPVHQSLHPDIKQEFFFLWER
jgi:putative redox protein